MPVSLLRNKDKPDDNDPGVPGFRTWRGVYLSSCFVLFPRCRDRADALRPRLLRMNALDWFVLLGTMLGIAAYGTWRTRHTDHLDTYLKGSNYDRLVHHRPLRRMPRRPAPSPSSPSPGRASRAASASSRIISACRSRSSSSARSFLPIYRKLGVYTAYEYLGQRFDQKTRLLGAGLFLAPTRPRRPASPSMRPAIILSTVLRLAARPDHHRHRPARHRLHRHSAAAPR